MIRHSRADPVGSYEIANEVICVLRWSGVAQKAFNRALASYNRAGRPGIPDRSENYCATFYAKRRAAKGAVTP